jgi:hypothetical protein
MFGEGYIQGYLNKVAKTDLFRAADMEPDGEAEEQAVEAGNRLKPEQYPGPGLSTIGAALEGVRGVRPEFAAGSYKNREQVRI